MLKLMGKKILTIYTQKFCLAKPLKCFMVYDEIFTLSKQAFNESLDFCKRS